MIPKQPGKKVFGLRVPLLDGTEDGKALNLPKRISKRAIGEVGARG